MKIFKKKNGWLLLTAVCLLTLGYAIWQPKIALAQSGVDITVNTAAVSGGTGGPLTTPITDTASVYIYDTPMVAMVKELQSAEPLRIDEPAHFTIAITNTGTITISRLSLEDRFSSVFLTYNPANTAPAHTTTANGIVTWDNLLPVNGLVPNQSILVDVYFDAKADTTRLPPVAPCTEAHATPNLAHLFNLQADPDGSGPLPAVNMTDQESCDSVRIFSPTGLLLTARGLTQTANGVLVQWATENEVDLVGFHIWRLRGLKAEQLTTTLLEAQHAGLTLGTSYEWLDTSGTLESGDVYLLEWVHTDNSTQRFVISLSSGGPLFLPMIIR